MPSAFGEGQVNMPIMTLVRERSITQLKNYLDLRKTAPTRPTTRIRSGTRPPNGTIKSIQKIVCTPSSHLGEVPAWAEGAQTTIKMPSPFGEGQVVLLINRPLAALLNKLLELPNNLQVNLK